MAKSSRRPPGIRQFTPAEGFRHNLRPRAFLPRGSGCAAQRQGHAGRVLVRRLAGRGGCGGCSHGLDKLVLVDPVGIKVSGRETPDILDVFNRSPDEVRRSSWHNPERFAPDFNAMSDEALVVYARNREALCLYAWHPYMYNPQLPRWLSRIKVPTLVLWGASDRIVTPITDAPTQFDPRFTVRADRTGRASSGNRTARQLCRARRRFFRQ